jgi:HEAT repeat protein
MLTIHDNGFIPESSRLEGYEASRAPGAYPLARVMKLAERAIRREARNVSEFARLLADENEVIRYWAAQGLLMLKTVSMPAAAALTNCLERDASHSVRIVVAEALALLGPAERSVQYLIGLLDGDADARLRLQALNALTFMGETARPALPAIERAVAQAGRDEYIRSAGHYLSLVLNGKYEPSSRIYQGPGARNG